jgi:hypothetical protein
MSETQKRNLWKLAMFSAGQGLFTSILVPATPDLEHLEVQSQLQTCQHLYKLPQIEDTLLYGGTPLP